MQDERERSRNENDRGRYERNSYYKTNINNTKGIEHPLKKTCVIENSTNLESSSNVDILKNALKRISTFRFTSSDPSIRLENVVLRLSHNKQMNPKSYGYKK